MTPRQLLTSKKQDWQTPKDLFDKLNAVFDFKIDPCTTDENPLGTPYFCTPENDGLKANWLGNAFVNPPYDNQEAFIRKAIDQCNEHNTTNVCLIPARTDTQLWQDLIFPNAPAVCFVRGRLKFQEPQAMSWQWLFGEKLNCATFPSAIVVFDADSPLTCQQAEVLQSIGHLYWHSPS